MSLRRNFVFYAPRFDFKEVPEEDICQLTKMFSQVPIKYLAYGIDTSGEVPQLRGMVTYKDAKSLWSVRRRLPPGYIVYSIGTEGSTLVLNTIMKTLFEKCDVFSIRELGSRPYVRASNRGVLLSKLNQEMRKEALDSNSSQETLGPDLKEEVLGALDRHEKEIEKAISQGVEEVFVCEQ